MITHSSFWRGIGSHQLRNPRCKYSNNFSKKIDLIKKYRSARFFCIERGKRKSPDQLISRLTYLLTQHHLQALTEPDLEASKELLSISRIMTKTDKDSFIGMLEQWHSKWKTFISERSVDTKSGKSYYTHKRLRSAYLSLKRNMNYLWTFYDYPNLGIPNTNNGIEGTFTDIKSKLRVHSGMKKTNRMRFIDEYLARHYYK